MPPENSNGWSEWSKYVLAELKRLGQAQEDTRKECAACREQQELRRQELRREREEAMEKLRDERTQLLEGMKKEFKAEFDKMSDELRETSKGLWKLDAKIAVLIGTITLVVTVLVNLVFKHFVK